MLFSCENLRNNFYAPIGDRATAARGVHVISEDLNADYLLNVYDYILNVEWSLNEFFLKTARRFNQGC
jgi:hypothetical protein